MALKSSFKQQCPSCEAMVPIRDAALVGRKIDCPKCKYRFVVEEPEEAEEEEASEPTKKGKSGGSAVTNKKPANGKAAKPVARRAGDEDDDEEEDQPAKKKSGGSGMLIAGLGLGAVAVIALIVCGVLLLGGSDKPAKSSGSPSAMGGAPAVGEVKQEKAGGDKKEEVVKPKLADATNLLPNDAQIVLNMPMDRLLGNPAFKKAVLMTPGSFTDKAFLQTWGIPAADITQVVMGVNVAKRSVFSVMQMAKAVKEDQVVAGLKLIAEKKLIEGQKYYLLKKPLDSLSTLLLKANQPNTAFALHFLDNYTVVCADLGSMQQFLQVKRQPKHLSEGPAPPPEHPQGGQPGGMPGGMPPGGMPPGGMPPGGMPPGGMPPGGMPPGGQAPAGAPAAPGGAQPAPAGAPAAPGGAQPAPAGAPPAPAGGNPPGGFRPPAGMAGPGMMGPGMMGPGMASGGGASNAAALSSSYLTIDPALKGVLDQVEKTEKKEQALLLSLAVQTSLLSVADLKKLAADQPEGPKVPDFMLQLGLAQLKTNIKAVGLGLTELTDSTIALALGMGARDEKLAQEAEKTYLQTLPKLVAMTGRDIVSKNGGQGDGMRMPNGGMRMPNGGMQMPNGGMPMPNGVGPNIRPGAGGVQPPNALPQPGAGGQPPNGLLPNMQPPNGLPPGMQPQGGDNDEKNEPKGKDGDYVVWSKDKVVAIGVNVHINEMIYLNLSKLLDEGFKTLKGMADMTDNRSRIHELAEATQAFVKDKGHFPRGTVARPPSADRVIEWRPDQRLSWMVQLLPYVANGEFKELPLDNEHSWSEPPANLSTARTVVPQFLAPLPPDKPYSYYIQYPGLKAMPVAATRFVGIAGIGLDAAEYRGDDPATAKLRGIFGYDRETKPDDIKDGLSDTILLIQVPDDHKAPWMAGGGSTVRGVSEDLDCVKSFVCTKYQNKDGTFAIMADGKVRFIPAAIDPKTFQALCTIAGGEKIKDLDAIAPVVPPPEGEPQPELKAEAPPPAANPAPQPVAPPPAAAPVADARTAALRTNQLKMIGLAYHNHVDANKRPPAKIEDLSPFYENDKNVTAAVKDGTFVVFWDASFQKMTAGTSNTILAYEKDAKDKGGLVLMADGSVKTMTAKEFAAAAKPPGK